MIFGRDSAAGQAVAKAYREEQAILAEQEKARASHAEILKKSYQFLFEKITREDYRFPRTVRSLSRFRIRTAMIYCSKLSLKVCTF